MNSCTLASSDSSQLLIIDIQEKLASAMPSQILDTVLKSCKILITAANDLSVPVIHTEQYPKGLGPTLSELTPLLRNQPAAIEKTCFSSCAANDVNQFLQDEGREQWILLGMEAHICVTQTCMQLLQQNKTVFIVADGVCSRTKSNYKNALSRMQNAGAIITNTESVLFEWLKDASHPEFRNLSRLIR